jgi:hypothetical protein
MKHHIFGGLVLFFSLNGLVSAGYVNTQQGKILHVDGGHIVPSCRMVLFQENGGMQMVFRIPNNNNGQDNGIAAAALAALIANRTVLINYDPSQTTGCGTEPEIQYITVF